MQNAEIKTEAPKHMTLIEAAAYLRISGRSMKQLIYDNKVTFLKPEGTNRYRFLKEDLDAYLNTGLTLSDTDAVRLAKSNRKKAS